MSKVMFNGTVSARRAAVFCTIAAVVIFGLACSSGAKKNSVMESSAQPRQNNVQTQTAHAQQPQAAFPAAQSAAATASRANTFTDERDDQKYRMVKIGNLTWMADNLNFRPRTGSLCYGADMTNCDKYGRLYDWNAAQDACPAGWRLPTAKNWDDLISQAGDNEFAAKKLKSKTGWSDNENGTDEFGFAALPGGFRSGEDMVFHDIGKKSGWWATIEAGRHRFAIFADNKDCQLGCDGCWWEDNWGFSIRCVKD
ncbi:MAG: fibrobacter succinogenes major paralogous domain-containing protein [Chitinispirillia bacterium]|nr:fibrobacter succinogenes major paralogous domain-containing protein [Chitinispirillia bacterium]